MPPCVASLPQVAPVIPLLRSNAFDDPDWLFESKLDVPRDSVSRRFESYVHLQTVPELARFSRLGEEVRGILEVRNAILDGEVVAIDDDDRANFRGFMSHQGHLHYAAFDLLWLSGKDLRKM